jgi:hypothetical protein
MVFVFAIIGFFAGRYVSLIAYKRKFAEKEALLKTTAASAATVAPVPPSDQPAPLADPAKYTELLRLWRDKSKGTLHVETSGHLLASSEPLNPAQKKRFVDLIKELANWTGIPATEIVPAAVEPVSKPASVPVATVPNIPQPTSAKQTTAEVPAPIKMESPVTPPPVQTPPPPPAPIPTIGVQPAVPPATYIAAVSAMPKPVAEPAKKQAVSMVEQIDEILQELVHRSDNPNRRIKLVEERNQGVIVWVDQDHFNGIDAVTNDSARELIRAAAKEWERRTESRL